MSIQLIVGLGNPGSEYQQTRHNVGFWWLDSLASQHRLQFLPNRKFFGDVGRLRIAAASVWLLKPQTYMNRSGQSVQALASYYQIPIQATLIVHDDLDLPPGIVRLKQGGGHGGNKGLRSIMQQFGAADFYRLRIGIGHPGDRDQVTPYVLGRPGIEDQTKIDGAIDKTLANMAMLQQGDYQKFMNEIHRKEDGHSR